KRVVNKGFESIAMTPNGKIYAALEIGMGNSFANTAKANDNASNQTEVIRLLEYDPATGQSQMFAYMIDAGYPVSGNDLRRRNIKIGDMVALNNNELLVIEHGIRGVQNQKKIYKVTLAGATPITNEVFLTAPKTFKSLEELSRSEVTTVAGLTPVGKTLVIDLTNPGPGNTPYPVSLEKAEGMTILNPTTIAITNDNDFGIISPNADGKLAYTGIPSDIVVYHLSAPLDYQLGVQGIVKRGDELVNGGTAFFANQSNCVGGMLTTPITVSNPSTRDLAITGADFYETDSIYAQGAPRYALRRDNAGNLIPMGDYSLSTQAGGLPISINTPVIVAPGATTTIYVTFAASRPTKRFARAYLRTNAQNFSDLDTGALTPSYGLLVFDLFARGTGSRLSADLSGRLPRPIVFREATVGDSTDAVLSLANPATCELRIAMADLRIFSGDVDQFQIVNLPTGTRVDVVANEWVIPPGGHDSLLVRFMPRQPGSHRATIALRSNDSTLLSDGYAGRGIYYLDLFGAGKSTLSLTNVDFGIALIGGTGGDQHHDLLHVTNSSPAATSIVSISIVGADTSEFHEDAARRWTALPRLLTPGEELDLGIVFAPITGGTPGPRSAMVKVVLVSGDTITAWLTGVAGT
ncbi:MAG: esterase-like activity of phytase family protein, partial [Bacteroidota bacterium]